MSRLSIAETAGDAQARSTPDLPTLKSSYREAAAWNLYEIVRPAGGLKWSELSTGQKQVYRNLIDQAAAQTAVEFR